MKEQLGAVLPIPNKTRWNAYFKTTREVMKYKMKLNPLLKALKLPNGLTPGDLEFSDEWLQVIEPLASALDILQGEENCYLGFILPTILSIKKRLECLPTSLKFCNPLRKMIIDSLNKRFQKSLNIMSSESDLYILASIKRQASNIK